MTNLAQAKITVTGSSASRSIGNRFADLINVKDFGATGNGITDDTAAIQAAINWTSGSNARGTVFFPPGRYAVTSTISLPVANFVLLGSGTASVLLANFHGFVFDQLSVPYGAATNGVVIEKLSITNSYAGQNINQASSSSWSASGSPVTINTPSLDSGVAAGCLVYILDQQIAPMPVFVGIVTSVVAGTSITVSSTAVGSSGLSNLNLALVQAYAANGSWTSSNSTITTAVSKPAGAPSGQCIVYDYDRILLGDGTVPGVYTIGLGVATWSGTTVTFTDNVSQASVGSSDKLVFAPLAGCIRLSSSVVGTIRDCILSGFICATTSQDNVNASGQLQGAEAFSILVQGCSLSQAGTAAAIGGTGIYLTNNSLSLCNDLNGFWIGTRLSGIACSIIGGRCEVCTYGVCLSADQNTGNFVAAANVLAGFSMESNTYAIVQSGGGKALISSLTILCQNSNGKYGCYIGASNTIMQGSGVQGSWQGYAIYMPDAGNTAGYNKFIGVTAVNNFIGAQDWRIPAQAWWGSCEQCNNPALVYTFANLPDGSGSPTPIEGETYDISDDNSAHTFLATASGGGSGTSAHRRVRYNAAASVWQVVG